MRIIAYTYEADVHCPACARARFGYQGAVAANLHRLGKVDECGVPYAATDSEGNQVGAVLSIAEHPFTHCGDCREELA